jgi:hypothetical protein
MLRGLGLRGSNSVCGRAIQKEPPPQDAVNYSHDQILDGLSSTPSSSTHLADQAPGRRTRRPRIVHVLDVAACADTHSDVYVEFTSRMHAWTTIKVSSFENRIRDDLIGQFS